MHMGNALIRVIEWLKGDGFDGLLMFDECHKVTVWSNLDTELLLLTAQYGADC